MKPKYSIVLVIVLLISAGMLAGCQFPSEPATPTTAPDAISTEAAMTVVAEFTQVALSFSPTPPAATDTPAPTATPEPTRTPLLTNTPESTPTPLPSDTPELTPGTATLTPRPTLPPGLLYEDDFSSQSGWYTDQADDFLFEFVSDGYRIYNNILGGTLFSIRQREITDAIIEVEVTKKAGPNDGYFGVVCRFVNGSNYYGLVIGVDGFYGISKMEDNEYTFLESGMASPGLIKPQGEVNLVRAECIGELLTLYANGEKLLEVEEDDFTSGAAGLLAGNKIVESGIDVTFHHITVYIP